MILLHCLVPLAVQSLALALFVEAMSDVTGNDNIRVTAPIVDLGYAKYQGTFDAQTNISSFLSIRYAAPPLGDLRFQAPHPPLLESGIQPATQNPDMCYQTVLGNSTMALVSPYGHNKRQTSTPVASEDCLFLNVFIPGPMPIEPIPTNRFPVLVWIHGGGYEYGYAAQYNGVDLVTDSLNSVVVVVIQYRLGVFGFLSGNEVKVQGALNAGLLDQNFALEWVQNHIGLFGGDKSHVTIWGESAGAGSVLQHIVANGGNTRPPLFHAAISSSMYLPPQYHYNDRVPQLIYNKVISMTGCSSSNDTFACVQSVDSVTLQSANHDIAVSGFSGTFIFVPVVDGTFIIERPTVTLSSGKLNGQVVLAVSNQNEGNIFVDANETLGITDYVSQLFPDMTNHQAQKVARVYENFETTLEQAIQVMADSIFVCPTYSLLSAFSGRSWKGLFSIPPAYHGNDCIYYFDSVDDPAPYNNTQFITAFSQSFMSLAKYYDVNEKFDPTNIVPYWEKYDIQETEMMFNRTEAGLPVIVPIKTDPKLLERCRFWSSVRAMTAQ